MDLETQLPKSQDSSPSGGFNVRQSITANELGPKRPSGAIGEARSRQKPDGTRIASHNSAVPSTAGFKVFKEDACESIR
jgi:hypothetical protein